MKKNKQNEEQQAVCDRGEVPCHTMTITWAMQNRILGFILDKAQKMAVG